MLPAAYAALHSHPEVPDDAKASLRSQFDEHGRRALRFTAELIGILRAFESSGIEVLSHKGPGLAKVLFEDVAMRQFGDLDLLVRAPDVSRARIALLELGYRPKLRLSKRQETAYLRAGYEYAFTCAAGANLVELQWQITPSFYSIAFDMDSLFSRSVETDWEGQRIPVLSNEDLLMVLCVHAAKHEWSQIGMIRDIARLASFAVDWGWISRESGKLNIQRILMISLLLARNLLGSELPSTLKSNRETAVCEKLACTLALKVAAGKQTNIESTSYFRSMMRVRERWRDRVRLAWRLAVTPNVGEWKSIEIPDALFSLYRGVRAVRLIRRLSHQR